MTRASELKNLSILEEDYEVCFPGHESTRQGRSIYVQCGVKRGGIERRRNEKQRTPKG